MSNDQWPMPPSAFGHSVLVILWSLIVGHWALIILWREGRRGGGRERRGFRLPRNDLWQASRPILVECGRIGLAECGQPLAGVVGERMRFVLVRDTLIGCASGFRVAQPFVALGGAEQATHRQIGAAAGVIAQLRVKLQRLPEALT